MITATEAKNNLETTFIKLTNDIDNQIIKDSKQYSNTNYIVPKHWYNKDIIIAVIKELENNGFIVRETFSTIMDRTILTIDWE